MLFYIIILLNISVQISSEKYNTKKKRGGALFGGGALFRKNTVLVFANCVAKSGMGLRGLVSVLLLVILTLTTCL